MKKFRIKKARNKEDSLSRLPDALLVSILSKLNELKDIFMFSFVCKHFASMVTNIQTLSLKFQAREIRFEDGFTLTPFSIGYKNSISFLKKLKKLEFLYLEFTCPRDASGLQGLKWKAECERKRAKLTRFICLLPISVQKTTQNQQEQEPENEEVYSYSYHLEFRGSRNYPEFAMFIGCFDCVHLLSILIRSIGSLKRVTITDSEKYGKLIVDDEQLVMWSKEHLDLKLKRFAKTAFLPILHLPSSGYVMKGVEMSIAFWAESEDVGKKDMMSWKYEGEEKILGEAVKETFAEHQVGLIVDG